MFACKVILGDVKVCRHALCMLIDYVLFYIRVIQMVIVIDHLQGSQKSLMVHTMTQLW